MPRQSSCCNSNIVCYLSLLLTSHISYFPVMFTFVLTKRICPNLSLVRICRRIQGISAKVQPACCVALPHPPPALPASPSFAGTAVLHGNVPRHEEAGGRQLVGYVGRCRIGCWGEANAISLAQCCGCRSRCRAILGNALHSGLLCHGLHQGRISNRSIPSRK